VRPVPCCAPAVILLRYGQVEQDDCLLLARFRDGMMNANRTALGRHVMTLWKLTGFEQVPADYDQTLTEIVVSPAPNHIARQCSGRRLR
jgi:hypothetical protein